METGKIRKLIKKLRTLPDNWQKRIFFVGILTKMLEPHDIKPVVVGGHAVEFYTLGGYTTGDIDLIVSDRKKLKEVLLKLGFEQRGRMWVHPEWELFVEVVNSNLTSGEKEHVVSTEFQGLKVYFLGIEDVIIDRLNAYVWWKSTDDGYWAEEMVRLFKDKLDIEYLMSKAKEEKVEKAVRKILRRIRKR